MVCVIKFSQYADDTTAFFNGHVSSLNISMYILKSSKISYVSLIMSHWLSGNMLNWRSRDRGFEPCTRLLLWSVFGQDSLLLVVSSVRGGRKMEVSSAGRIIPCACKRTHVIFR